jgi:hypothetical protein
MRRGTTLGRLLLFVAGAASLAVPSSAHVLGAGTTVDNGDGTYTFTQQVDGTSTTPYYKGPWANASGDYGFDFYSGYDQDFGWLHTFPQAGDADLLILSVTLGVRAYDVDSNILDGEFDGVSADGDWLNPQFLQGFNNGQTTTTFDVDPGALSDGELHVYVDIDMLELGWRTTLDSSTLEVHYTYATNQAPYPPVLARTPAGSVGTADPLVVDVIGPTPADPDGDAVTYRYRWFVDVGTGFYVDDEFAQRGDHSGCSVPPQDTEVGDRWLVEVVAEDASGARSSKVFMAFPTVGADVVPPVADAGPDMVVPPDTVTLNGGDSYDPDGEIAEYLWEMFDGEGWVTLDTGVEITVTLLEEGTYTIRLTVFDNQGLSDSALVYVTVIAPQPPVIQSVWANPAVLWSPNHKMVEVTVTAMLSDEATYAIDHVESNVPPDDGSEPDWEITGDHTVLLRSERSGGGEGRVYTVTIVATNDSGSTTAEVLVPVSHDQSGKEATSGGTGSGPKQPAM